MSLKELIVKAQELGRSVLTKDGSEVPDPTPMEIPIGFQRPESIQSMIQRLVRDPAIRRELDSADVETFDEADDFEEDPDFPQSPHEDQFDPHHLLAREQEVNSGFVQPRSQAEIAAAAKAIADYREKHKPAAPAKVA